MAWDQTFTFARFRFTGIRTRLATMTGLRRQRLALARLDAHLLRDIGVTALEAQAEAEREPWDVPAHWKN